MRPAAVGDNVALSFHQSPATLTSGMINVAKTPVDLRRRKPAIVNSQISVSPALGEKTAEHVALANYNRHFYIKMTNQAQVCLAKPASNELV